MTWWSRTFRSADRKRKQRSCAAVALALLLLGPGLAFANDAASSLENADTLVADHRFNQARPLYERAMAGGARLDTNATRAANVAAVYLNSTPPDEVKAVKWLHIALQLNPQADGIRAQLAGALLHSGDAGAAVEHYRILVNAHPGTAEYVVALSRAMRAAGQSDAALELLQTTVDRFPNLVPVRVEYARVLNFTRQFAEAKRQFAVVLATDPTNVIAQVGRAKTSAFEGDQETALATYDHVLQRHAGLYDAIVGKAFSLLWSGRVAQARKLFEAALLRHPDDQEVRQALRNLRLANPAAEPKASGVVRQQATHSVPANSARRAPNDSQSFAAEKTGRSQPADTGRASSARTWQFILFLVGGCLLVATIACGLALSLRRRCLQQGTRSAKSSRALCSHLTLPKRQPASGQVSTTSADPIAQANATARSALSLAESGDVSLTRSGAQHNETVAAARVRRQVLLVGGSRNLVELESRWLVVHNAQAIAEREWIPAIARFVSAPPELIVLNAQTEDGWTSLGMLDWIAANQPHLRDRTLTIVGTQEQSRYNGEIDTEARCLLEPFGGKEWQQCVLAMLGTATYKRVDATL